MNKQELISQAFTTKIDDTVKKFEGQLSMEAMRKTMVTATILSTIGKAAWYSFLVYLATLLSPVAAVVVGLVMFVKVLGTATMHKISMQTIENYFSK